MLPTDTNLHNSKFNTPTLNSDKYSQALSKFEGIQSQKHQQNTKNYQLNHVFYLSFCSYGKSIIVLVINLPKSYSRQSQE